MEQVTLQPINLKKEALQFGLIWAFIDIVIFLVTYYVKPEAMTSMYYGGISYLIKIGLVIFFSLELRKKMGGYWTFKEALSAIFIMFVSSGLITYIFTTIFAKWIEPDYSRTMITLTEQSTLKMFESMGMDQDTIDKSTTDLREKLEAQFNPGIKEAFTTFGIMVIFNFVGALIFAAIFKKNKPVMPVFSSAEDKEEI